MDRRKVIYGVIGLLVALLIVGGELLKIPDVETITISSIDSFETMYDKEVNDSYYISEDEVKRLVGYEVKVGEIENVANKGRKDPTQYETVIQPIEFEIDDDSWMQELGNTTEEILDVLKNKSGSFFKAMRNGVAKGYNKSTGAVQDVEIASKLSRHMNYLRLPLKANQMSITSNFGVRVDPINGKGKGEVEGKTQEELINDLGLPFHTGTDYAVAGIMGSDIYSMSHGIVKDIQHRNTGYGNMVTIEHDGFSTLYAHLSKVPDSLREGDLVEAGQVIGQVGSTGRSTGPHLHLEILFGDIAVDPELVVDLIKSGRKINYINKEDVENNKLKPLED